MELAPGGKPREQQVVSLVLIPPWETGHGLHLPRLSPHPTSHPGEEPKSKMLHGLVPSRKLDGISGYGGPRDSQRRPGHKMDSGHRVRNLSFGNSPSSIKPQIYFIEFSFCLSFPIFYGGKH